MVHIWARVTGATGAAGGRIQPRILRDGLLSLSGPGSVSECEGRNEVRKALLREAHGLGWKCRGFPACATHPGGGQVWFWWDLSEGFHGVCVCSCEKLAWPEAPLH